MRIACWGIRFQTISWVGSMRLDLRMRKSEAGCSRGEILLLLCEGGYAEKYPNDHQPICLPLHFHCLSWSFSSNIYFLLLTLDMAHNNLLNLIGYLPSEVIDAILVCLPIKDAVRTSILSRNWRHKWHVMSELKFDMRCLPPSWGLEGSQQLSNLVRLVDSVLTLHIGPVRRFELLTKLPCFSDVDRWIIFLSRNHIEEIILMFSKGEPYSVPSSLFGFEALTYLELHYCMLKPRGSFNLPKLTTLKLVKVHDPGERLGALISNCPCLEKLHLEEIEGPSHLKIHIPNLQELFFRNIYCELRLENALYVTDASFTFFKYITLKNGEEINMAKYICCLPNIEKLLLEGFAVQYFYSGCHALDRLPNMFDRLNSLVMEIDFRTRKEFMASLFLFRSFPNLKSLGISVASDYECATATTTTTTTAVPDSWESKDLNLTFNCLQVVKMTGIIGVKQELCLIKCILATAPLLRVIKVSINHSKRVIDESKIFVELMSYRRASALAEIIYTDV